MSRIDPNMFRWTQGEHMLTTYVGKQGAGIGFCRQCGTTLCGIFDGSVRGITLGSLNDDPAVTIGHHIFVGSKACWDQIGGDAPQFEEWPDASKSDGD